MAITVDVDLGRVVALGHCEAFTAECTVHAVGLLRYVWTFFVAHSMERIHRLRPDDG